MGCLTRTDRRLPVVAIAAHIPSAEIGSSYFQETHPEQLFRECSSFCELVSSPAQMPRALETAVRRAVSERCVSVLVIPGDVALKEAVAAPEMAKGFTLYMLKAVLNGQGDQLVELAKANLFR
jgi:pyruvate dehydrogenase (quinone)